MKTILKTSLISILVILTIGACKKYEEGPAISLRSKEKRLCQTWKLVSWTENGDIVDMGDIFYTWELSKNGDFTVTVFNNCCPDYVVARNTSIWRWADDKESIEIISFDDESWYANQIKKLKFKELIIEYSNSEIESRYKFEPYGK
jgi:hypothetical protein